MDNDKRFEIHNKIITIDHIKEISTYLQGEKKYYLDLIIKDKEKNENKWFNDGQYSYYAIALPKVEYEIEYFDGRDVETEDEYVFIDALKEPQYIKNVMLKLYISYKDNEFDEETEHTMSLYLSFDDTLIVFSTSDKNMRDQSYNLNLRVQSILESGDDKFDKILKNRFLIKTIVKFGFGIILSTIILTLMYISKLNGGELFDSLSQSSIIFFCFIWLVAYLLGSLVATPLMNSLYEDFDSNLDSNINGVTRMNEMEYQKTNEVLIGNKYNNLKKRKQINQIYNIAIKIDLIMLIVSIIITIILS